MSQPNEPFQDDAMSDSDGEQGSFVVLQSARTPLTASAGPSSASSRTTSGAYASRQGQPLSAATATATPSGPNASGAEQATVSSTLASFSSSHTNHPRHPLHLGQSRMSHLRGQNLYFPLPDDDSCRPRAIMFGTLKRGSMASGRTPSSLPISVGKRSKLDVLPSYLRYTTFQYHFQPEGAWPLDHQHIGISPMENEHTERRRPHADNGRRRAHFRQDSHSDSSASEDGDSSSSSESGSSSYENDSGTCTPKLDPRPLRYQLPSRWCTVHKTEKTELSEDDLQVRYTGAGKVDQDASAIRANRPIPPQCGIYYFEVYIKSKGEQGYIGVGVCNPLVALDRLPGWEPQSWGYHGDDGNSFGGCGSGRPFGPVFTTGDTIGCGVNFRDMSLFYTKNGVYLGIAFRDLKGHLFPTVGMRTAGEIIEANFGQQEFVFNIDDYVKKEKEQAWHALETAFQKATAKSSQVPSLPQSTSQLVLSYMIHHGYSESAKQLSSDLALQSSTLGYDDRYTSSASSAASEPSSILPAILDAERRKVIRQSILNGDVDKAMELLERHYPGVMADEDMVLQLRCQKFIGMVNSVSTSLNMLDHLNGQGEIVSRTKSPHDIEMAPSLPNGSSEQMDVDRDNANELEDLGSLKPVFEYGRGLQDLYNDNRRPFVQDMLKQTFATLAHTHSTHHGLEHHRIADPIPCEKVASSVNTAILASQSLPTTAPLETLCQQTNVAISELTRLGVGEAAFLDYTE